MASRSLTADTYEKLKAELLGGQLLPGSKLKIDELRTRLDVSPGAVREALSRLTSDGLVVSVAQKGFIVSPISTEDLRDLTAVRIEIETRCLRDSIENGDLAWEGRILDVWHRLSRTEPVIGDHPTQMNPVWTEYHSELHDTLIDACTSQWWLKLRDQMYLQAERYRRLLLPYQTGTRDTEAEHRGIVEATLARDAGKACALLTAHLRATADQLLSSDAPFDS